LGSLKKIIVKNSYLAMAPAKQIKRISPNTPLPKNARHGEDAAVKACMKELPLSILILEFNFFLQPS